MQAPLEGHEREAAAHGTTSEHLSVGRSVRHGTGVSTYYAEVSTANINDRNLNLTPDLWVSVLRAVDIGVAHFTAGEQGRSCSRADMMATLSAFVGFNMYQTDRYVLKQGSTMVSAVALDGVLASILCQSILEIKMRRKPKCMCRSVAHPGFGASQICRREGVELLSFIENLQDETADLKTKAEAAQTALDDLREESLSLELQVAETCQSRRQLQPQVCSCWLVEMMTLSIFILRSFHACVMETIPCPCLVFKHD